MDMRKHLKPRLNNDELLKMGGSYEGIIANVVEETVRNGYTKQRQAEPNIVFMDGWRHIPNIRMRRALIESLGEETNGWVGWRIRIFLRRVERKTADGGMREQYEKFAECIDPPVREPRATTPRKDVEELTAADISWEDER